MDQLNNYLIIAAALFNWSIWCHNKKKWDSGIDGGRVNSELSEP